MLLVASGVVWTLRASGSATYPWRDLGQFSPDICVPIPTSELNEWTVVASLSLSEFRSTDMAWPRTLTVSWLACCAERVSAPPGPARGSELNRILEPVSMQPVCRLASMLQFWHLAQQSAGPPVKGLMTLPPDLGSPVVRAQLWRSAPPWAPCISSRHGHLEE